MRWINHLIFVLLKFFITLKEKLNLIKRNEKEAYNRGVYN